MIIDDVCEQLAFGKALSRICSSNAMPDRRTIHRWASKNSDLAHRILTARRLGAWAMFDETTDRLMKATPQTVQVERELAHHVRWTISKLVAEVFCEQRGNPALNVTGNNFTIRWILTGEEGSLLEPKPDAPGLPGPRNHAGNSHCLSSECMGHRRLFLMEALAHPD